MELGVPKTTQGVLAEGLLLIEECYRCTKLTLVHEFLQAMEFYGGAAEETVLLILEDIENWKKRDIEARRRKKKYHADNVISIVVSVILCAVALYVLEGMGQMFQRTGRVVYFFLTGHTVILNSFYSSIAENSGKKHEGVDRGLAKRATKVCEGVCASIAMIW